MVMTQPGVWNTGDRHTGVANGSGLETWTTWSPENVDIFITPPPGLRRGSGSAGSPTRRRLRRAPLESSALPRAASLAQLCARARRLARLPGRDREGDGP